VTRADAVSAAVALQAVEPPAAALMLVGTMNLMTPDLDVPGLHLVSEGQAAAPVEAAPADAGSPDHLQEVLVPAMAKERICHSSRLGVVAENNRTAVKAHLEATDETLPNPVNQVAGADDERTVPVDLAGHCDRDRCRFGVDLVDELEEVLEILLEGVLEATRYQRPCRPSRLRTTCSPPIPWCRYFRTLPLGRSLRRDRRLCEVTLEVSPRLFVPLPTPAEVISSEILFIL
jgi:hypothetical protein